MEVVCNSKALISAIKSQEVVWNYKLKEHSDKIKKKNAWAIICAQVIEKFYEKPVEEKNQIAMLIQKKWKTLRDGYTRYCKKIKRMSGSATPNIRPYAYYEQMSFLKATIEDRPGKTNSLQESEHSEITSEESENSQNERIKERKRRKLTTTITDENALIEKLSKRFDEISQSSRIADEDEDKLFLLSLISEFKKIDEQYKLDAKTEILNVIKQFKEMTNQTHPSSYGDRGNSSQCSSFNDYSGQWGNNTDPFTSTSVTGSSTSVADYIIKKEEQVDDSP